MKKVDFLTLGLTVVAVVAGVVIADKVVTPMISKKKAVSAAPAVAVEG